MGRVITDAPPRPPAVELAEVVPQTGAETFNAPIALSIGEGDRVGIVGSSSGGKYALMELMSLRSRPASGSVRWFGRRVDTLEERALRPVRARFGVAIRSSGLLSNMTVIGNVMLPVRYHGIGPIGERARFVEEALRELGLWPHHLHLPAALDPGRQKLAAIVRALATGPDVLLIEEAAAGLDPGAVETLRVFLESHCRRTGMTLIFSTSHLPLVEALANRIVGFDAGRLLHDHRPRAAEAEVVEIT